MTDRENTQKRENVVGSRSKEAKKARKRPAPARPGSPADAAAAWAAVEREVDAADSSETKVIRLAVPTMVSLVLGAVERVKPLRSQLAELSPEATRAYDRLRTLALALMHAHVQLGADATAIARPLDELLSEATPLRERLLQAAETLAFFDYFDRDRVAEIRAGSGHIDKAGDLVALATLFRAGWSEVRGKSPVTEAEIDRAAALGPALLTKLGCPEDVSSPAAKTLWSERRLRVFASLARSYDEVRRAVTYLRWSDVDAEALAPSLYTSRRRPTRIKDGRSDEGEGGTDGGDVDGEGTDGSTDDVDSPRADVN